MKNTETAPLCYSDEGTGHAVVLLHGYLETHEIWGNFAKELSKTFRVIAVDIPGHGRSPKVSEVHSMEMLADMVDDLLKKLGIEKVFLVGHSMGGYVALSYLANYGCKVSGICMFHSTPFADTPEKAANRDREIQIVKQGKQEVLFNTNVPKGFATDNLCTLNDKVETAKRIAAGCQPDGIIALLEGLKIRPDRQALLRDTATPVLYILGKKDNYIPFDLMYSVAQRTPLHEVLVLENSGHMGFVEEQGLCLEALRSFIMQYARGH